MNQIYVIDTVTFINYFNKFFQETRILSKKASDIIDKCLSSEHSQFKIIIPSIVLIEVFEKQLKTDERSEEFKYTILKPLFDNPDVEIKPLEQEVLQTFVKIDSSIVRLENHDKIILSSAIQMQVPIITNDSKIQSYLKRHKVIEHFF